MMNFHKLSSIEKGILICICLFAAGIALQLSIGSVEWHAFSFPINIYMLVGLAVAICGIYMMGEKVPVFRLMRTSAAAVPALALAALLTVCMGLVKQVPGEMETTDRMGFEDMVSSWWFVLIYLYIVIILGLVVCHRLRRLRWHDVPFLMNHLGLLLFIVAATLGSADIQQLTMNVTRNVPERRAIDEQYNMVELPIGIRLVDFTIDEYPPKLVLVDNATGREVRNEESHPLLIDKQFSRGKMGGRTIRLIKKIEDAAPVMSGDTTIGYVPSKSAGAMCAVLVDVCGSETMSDTIRKDVRGWITCGSYLFPCQTLALEDSVSIAMADREPQRFCSRVEVSTDKGEKEVVDIEVNKPFAIDGWKIYQLSYDTSRGKWSEVSVLKLVKDPWLPVVYVGIFMLAIGALCMIFTSNRRKEKRA
jgi:hypothetical protein